MSKRPIRFDDYSKSHQYYLKRRRPQQVPPDSDSESETSEHDQADEGNLEHIGSDEANPEHEQVETLAEEPALLSGGSQEANSSETGISGNEEGVLTVTSQSSGSELSDIESDRPSISNRDSDSDPDFSSPSSSTDTGEEENEDEEDPPLYPGAPITLSQSMLAILSLSMSHSITKACLADILKLIELHCIEPNFCRTSLYGFSKYFADMHSEIIRHFFCSACLTTLASKNAICEECNENKGVEYFLEIPILSQLITLFERAGFLDKLTYRNNRTKQAPENIEDIYDGALYKENCEGNNILASNHSVSLMWYTDGIAIFRSSKYEVWPLFFSINELPYSERFKKDNIILAGLWFGTKKPVPELFLSIFHEDITTLSNGIDFNVPNYPNLVRIRGLVLCGTCDMPAKALMLNLKQFNGMYGCHKCKSRGERYREVRYDQDGNVIDENDDNRHRRGPGVQVYPFERHLELRTDDETLQHAVQAVESNSPVYGVKGPSALAYITKNYIRSTAIDTMHLISNLVKQLNKFWFDPCFRDHDFCISGSLMAVDARIKQLTSPCFVERPIRSYVEHGPYWNISELKIWLFCYSVAILSDILPEEYLEHHKGLVMGLYILHQPSISPVMLQNATSLLTEYVSRYEDLYGRRYMSCTIHSLLHLPDVVRDFGPLWTTSCFPLESLNGVLKYLVRGTRFADLQISNAASMFQKLTTLKEKTLIPGSKVNSFCEKLSKRSLRLRTHRVSERMFIVGKCERVDTLPEQVEEALEHVNIEGENFFIFHRLLLSGTLFCSEIYNQKTRTKSCCVKYDASIGLIQCFVRVTDCVCRRLCNCVGVVYAVVRKCVTNNPFSTDAPRVTLTFVHQWTQTAQIEGINVERFETVCFYFKINDTQQSFAVEPVNRIEKE